MEQPKGFFGALFDFTFTDFITTKIIKLLYILLLIAVGVGALVAIVTAFGISAWLGLLTLLILAPLGFVIGVICIRVYMEIIIVLFRIAENTNIIAQSHQSKTPPEAPLT
ncbi:DUF4282 domain-containing protein [bacterium]|nr:DUF4282 domain-containing protein [bacterium]MBU1936451.1 DUF4282 domain-containing protein [bacterium]